jgi:polysaccharide deacetylase 2 family uncharacterized protein YibQ
VARKKQGVNRRKSSGGGRPLVALLIVAFLIAGAFLVLEYSRRTAPPAQPPATAIPPAVQQVQPVPPHIEPQSRISTAVVAPPAVKPLPPAPAAHPKGAGRVAIIIDDMGTNLSELQQLLAIKQPLTFSVIPSLAHAKGVAEAAHQAGAEVMVHMPMEPEGYPKQRLESIGLLLSMDDAEIAKRVNSYFATVPHAVGANNHMGSRFTQDAKKMEVVLRILKDKGMFFVDSKTSPASVGYGTAQALGMKSAARQVFLDNVQDEAAIGKQLAQVAAVARKKGSAIAICHPHPATIRTLTAVMPQLAREGITFVHASALTM